MNDALCVSLGKRSERLPRHVDGGLWSEALLALEPLPDALAFEQLHRQVELARLTLAEVEDRDRVRRLEGAVGARFAEEPRLGGVVHGAIGSQDLDRHLTVDRDLARSVHRAHGPGAQLRDDRETSSQRPSEHGVARRVGEILRAHQKAPVIRAVRGRAFAFVEAPVALRADHALDAAVRGRRFIRLVAGGGERQGGSVAQGNLDRGAYMVPRLGAPRKVLPWL